jgi:iron(III) transport system substrate-binding protein
VGLLLVAGCSSSGDGETLQVYSGRHYDVEIAFEGFAEETGVSVEFLNGNDAELRERIVAEGEDTQADVYLTVDAGNLARGAQQGIFQPLESEVLTGAVPEALRDPDDLWFGLAVRVRTIVYSTERMGLDEVPTTYEELAEPSWDGRVCMRDSSNVYQQSLVASLIAAHGEEEAVEIVRGWADGAEILANDILILESIADGLCDVGVTNHYYLGRLLEEDAGFPVGLVWANQDGRGVHVNISGGGVTRYADDPDLAQRFLEWLATEGQKPLVDSNHEYPANPEVEPEPLIAGELGTDFAWDPLSAAELGGLNADAVRVMDEAGFR